MQKKITLPQQLPFGPESSDKHDKQGYPVGSGWFSISFNGYHCILYDNFLKEENDPPDSVEISEKTVKTIRYGFLGDFSGKGTEIAKYFLGNRSSINL